MSAFLMPVSDRVVVLDSCHQLGDLAGRKIADAAPAGILGDPAVIRAYLGSEAA